METTEIILPETRYQEVGRSMETSTDKPFIQANTIVSSFTEIKDQHIIPVFIKDNEPVISHTDFIEVTQTVVSEVYGGEEILQPSIRVSHPVKGRIPDARNKPASELLEHEKTLYYERMAFVIELPGVYDVIEGNTLSLTVGGVNGYISDLRVKSVGELKANIRHLVEGFSAQYQLQQMKQLTDFSISEQQFATLVGRCRMYQHLPPNLKGGILQMLMGDNQIGAICKDFYNDQAFRRNEDGSISLWRIYNLFTGANKSTYIDNFLDRSVNAYHFVEQIRFALQRKTFNWYMS